MVRTAVVLGAVILMHIAPASAQDCAEAWYQRNAIYKQGGYCFRTPRAISAFGNAGCTYDAVEDVPLSARQRAAVAEIQAFERANGCPR
ncbi:YARHG domain-containing protein [uncultured Methylobacterium sp.]|uniref:YARHG domain-containing protein n=1 Tax=uncultured Methylobacterium sp. TaxID=157278 RepID=UPI0035C9B7AD